MSSTRDIIADLLIFRLRLQYQTIYDLTDKQYDLVEEFFKSNKSSNELISTELLRKHFLIEITKRNGQIKANNEDVTRWLELFDEDKDGYLNLSELFGVLSLSTTRDINMSKRILQYLRSVDNFHVINPDDGNKHLEFLNSFFSPNSDQLVEANKSYSKKDQIFELLHVPSMEEKSHLKSKLVSKLSSSAPKTSFAQQLAVYLKEAAFVTHG